MLPTQTKYYSFSLLLLCTLGLRQAMSITLTLWLTFWKAHVRPLWILMLMHKWIASTLSYATIQALVLQILYNTFTYTLICIWTLTGGFIYWILKHYLLIPGDDISSDLDLSGCNINTDNEEKEKSYTKSHWYAFGYSTWSQATVWAKGDNWYQWSWPASPIQIQCESKK